MRLRIYLRSSMNNSFTRQDLPNEFVMIITKPEVSYTSARESITADTCTRESNIVLLLVQNPSIIIIIII